MKLKIKVFVPLLALFSCLYFACGPGQEDAVAYNDRLVSIYDQAHSLDARIEETFKHDFPEFLVSDSAFNAFIQNFGAEYKILKDSINATPDLGKQNQMKETLSELIDYMANSLQTYYPSIVKNTEGDEKEKQLVMQYNTEYTKRYDAFQNAQKKLAEEFELTLEKKQ